MIAIILPSGQYIIYGQMYGLGIYCPSILLAWYPARIFVIWVV